MGSFEDKIKSKFENASVTFNAEAWDAVDQKLDQGQMSDLLFSQKVVNAFHFTAIPYSPKHWSAIQSSLNELQQENRWKGRFDEAVYSGPVLGWEKMEQKLADTQLSPFESGVKNKLSSAQVSYQAAHWNALLKTMVWRNRLKAIKTSAVFALVGLSAFLIINSNVNDGVNGEVNSELNEKAQKNRLEAPGQSKTRGTSNKNQKHLLKPDINQGLEVYSGEVTGVDGSARQSELKTFNSSNASFTGVKVQNRSVRNSVSSKNDSNNSVFNNGKGTKAESLTKQKELLSKNEIELKLKNEANAFHGVEIKAQELGLLENNLPILNKTSTDVALLEEKESFFHVGLAPMFAFWDNPSVTGLYGQQQFSCYLDREWISYQNRNKKLGFEWKQPMVLMGGYEYSFNNTGFAVGGYISNKRTENWKYSEFNLTASYEMDLGSSLLRVGTGLNYSNNKLQTNGLSLREQVFNGTEVYTRERDISDIDVDAEQLLKVNMGALLLSKYYLLSYSLRNPVLLKVNHESPLLLNHNLTIGGNIPFYNFKLTALLTVERSDLNYYTPGLAMSYNDHWFSLIEYQNLEGFNFNVGRQFNNGCRVYASFGSVVNSTFVSSINEVYSFNGHIGLGINCIIR